MSRAGISMFQVREVYASIKTKGEHPSAQRVRDALGGGSMTTINGYLRIIRAEEEGTRSLETLGQVSPELVKTVVLLNDQLRLLAQAQIAEAQAAFDQKLQAAEAQRAEVEARLEAIEREMTKTTDELTIARSMYQAERDQLVAAKEQIASLTTQVEAGTATIADLKEQLSRSQGETRHAIAQREHFQKSAAEERQRLLADHGQAVAGFQAQISTLNTQLMERAQQHSDSLVHLSAVEAELSSVKAANADLRESQATLIERINKGESSMADLRHKLDAAVAQEREARNMAAQASAGLAEAKQSAAIAQIELSHAKEETAQVREQLKACEALIEGYRKAKEAD